MKVFAFDGPLGQVLDKICSLILLNFAFIITSLPIVTIGVSVTAMHRCLPMILSDDHSKILKQYFRAFKSNFRKSMLISLCILPFLVIAVCDAMLYFVSKENSVVGGSIIAFIPMVLLFAILSYLFPLQARFENTVLNTLKNAVLLALGYFPSTILMTAVNVFIPILAFLQPTIFMRLFPLWLFFGFSGPGIANTILLNGVIARSMSKQTTAENRESDVPDEAENDD